MAMLTVIVSALAAVAALTVVYHVLPSRKLTSKKPVIAFFPKYSFRFDDAGELVSTLGDQGFREISSNIYVRGRPLGDFLAKWVKLRVAINFEQKSASLSSGSTAILFDTGDLWKIAHLLSGEK